MNRRPFIFNLMLSTIFLPIIITLAIVLICALLYAPEDIFQQQGTTFGLSDVWITIALITLPFALWLWILASGKWRNPLLTAALVYGGLFIAVVSGFLNEYSHTHPEKRMIHLRGIEGTSVYCNGVYLGQLPLEIRVDELKAKVPVWNSPPEQRWLDDSNPEHMLYTWFPWDDFLEERFLASQALFQTQDTNINIRNFLRVIRARLNAIKAHDAECQFWWSFQLGQNQKVVQRSTTSYYLNRSFDKNTSYYFSNVGIMFSPSSGFHAQLLADVLPELTPEQKFEWDQHVLKHWPLIWKPLGDALHSAASLHNRTKDGSLAKLYETALHSTARLKYRYSEPLSESGARWLLANWVQESNKNNLFTFNIPYNATGDWSSTPIVSFDTSPLIHSHLAESMRGALTEQWRKNKYRFENGWAPLAYFSQIDQSPDYFGDFARYSATTHNARVALLENQSPQTTALFRTLLHRRSMAEILYRQINVYPSQISAYANVNNPLVEPVMRRHIEMALSDPNHNEWSRREVNTPVLQAVLMRIHWDNTDKDELAAWIASLPMNASSKNHALRTLRIHRGEGLTFADRLQLVAGSRGFGVEIQTELTLDDLTNWFAEHPDGSVMQFLVAMEEDIFVSHPGGGSAYFSIPGMWGDNMVSFRHDTMDPTHIGLLGLSEFFVTALLRSDTAEGDPQIRDLIRRIWRSDPALVASAVRSENTNLTPVELSQRMPGSTAGSSYVPEYILELLLEFEDISDMGTNLGILSHVLAMSSSPTAGKILEKWNKIEFSALVDRQVASCLEIWQTREAMRFRKMEIFENLLVGRMAPDDLLFEQPPWIWQDGQYVPASQ
ncbi:MAG: hypothetical protein FWG73_06870 [Planctomycetaceae bacterium]|nr:hypothetical protein [Planctomycetaceae bacterium]